MVLSWSTLLTFCPLFYFSLNSHATVGQHSWNKYINSYEYSKEPKHIHLNCYLIEIQVSTIKFSVYYQHYTMSILSFVQRGISYIKTQYTIVKNETYMYTSEYISTILQVSGMFLSVFVLTLSSAVTHTDQNWHQLTRWVTIGRHQERHDKWKCAMTNKYASMSCGRTGMVPSGRGWNVNINFLHARHQTQLNNIS